MSGFFNKFICLGWLLNPLGCAKTNGMKKLFQSLVLLAGVVGAPTAQAEGLTGFAPWLQAVRNEALAQGIAPEVWHKASAQMEFLPDVIRLDRKQPEKTITFATYRRNVVTEGRVQQARALYSKHRALLERIAAQYGVPAKYILALWGMETSFGQNTGSTHTLSALATLAYEGRRSDFFKRELFNAIKIVQEGHGGHYGMAGSWAGAMGQCQFMPSSYLKYAVDGDGNGTRDIWRSLPDVFASIANYLSSVGWAKDQRWGREVRVPLGFAQTETDLKTTRPLSAWAKLGVKQADGQPLATQPDLQASLVRPDGVSGPSYLVYDNYRTIMDWNRSTYFATSVGLLADRIGG